MSTQDVWRQAIELTVLKVIKQGSFKNICSLNRYDSET